MSSGRMHGWNWSSYRETLFTCHPCRLWLCDDRGVMVSDTYTYSTRSQCRRAVSQSWKSTSFVPPAESALSVSDTHLVPRCQQPALRSLEAGTVVGGKAQGVRVDEEHASRGVVRGSVHCFCDGFWGWGDSGDMRKETKRTRMQRGGRSPYRGGGGMKLVTRLAAEAKTRLSGSHKKAESSLCVVYVCVVRVHTYGGRVRREEESFDPIDQYIVLLVGFWRHDDPLMPACSSGAQCCCCPGSGPLFCLCVHARFQCLEVSLQPSIKPSIRQPPSDDTAADTRINSIDRHIEEIEGICIAHKRV